MVAAAFEIPAAVIAPQAATMAEWCRERLKKAGIYPILIERADEAPATTVALPNGKPGAYDLFIQRVASAKVSELAGAPTEAFLNAQLVVMGSIAEVNRETLQLHEHVAANAQFRALFPHSNLIECCRFAEIARLFDYVQMNVTEARLLDPYADGVAQLGLRLRWLLEEKVEFAITNGGDGEGILWAQDDGGFRWCAIRPAPVKVISDIGAGDVWGTSYLIFRRLFGESAAVACSWATRTAGRAISGQPLVQAAADAVVNRNWAEIA
jgi:sugar/nucleoside kinase (ribokinase family)